jgi:hypothetical protein
VVGPHGVQDLQERHAGGGDKDGLMPPRQDWVRACTGGREFLIKYEKLGCWGWVAGAADVASGRASQAVQLCMKLRNLAVISRAIVTYTTKAGQ